MTKLWQYNLHYFDWLWVLDFAPARQAVLQWMEHCPPDTPDAWEPYPLSLRVLNWCGFFWQRFRAGIEADAGFQQRLWQSLYVQLEWLCANLEYHLLGNHLLENAAALAFAGCCFSGPAGARWLDKGQILLRRELKEQMLSDGMHFERSPMYHARVTFLLLLLHASGHEGIRKLIQPYLRRALGAIQLVCHPDGQIALLNDSVFGTGNTPLQLLDWGRALGVSTVAHSFAGPWSLPAAGYYGCRSDTGFCVLCDAGPVGPDYIPGHAHGDIFSFEFSCRDHRIIVDSGVFDYVPSGMRRYCRSTPAHNTVTLDGQDQCEFWRAFRVARRGRPHDVKWNPSAAGFRLDGWHDGYQRLPGHPWHSRQFAWHQDGVLMVRDEIGSGASAEAVARIHLHPDCQIVKAAERNVELSTPEGPFAVRFSGSGALQREESWYCPEFGKKVPNQVLAWSHRGKRSRFGFCVAPVRQIESFDLDAGAAISARRYCW